MTWIVWDTKKDRRVGSLFFQEEGHATQQIRRWTEMGKQTESFEPRRETATRVAECSKCLAFLRSMTKEQAIKFDMAIETIAVQRQEEKEHAAQRLWSHFHWNGHHL